MEFVKDTYLESFTKRVGESIVEEMREAIKAEDVNIRASYHYKGVIEEMKPKFFRELILKDSVFIMEFIIRLGKARGTSTSSDSIEEDSIVHQPAKTARVIADLMLLENQLPYFIFDRLFGPHLTKVFSVYKTFNDLILELFSLNTKIKRNTNFMHFTDMYRCAYEESLDDSLETAGPAITEMQNADNLSRVGVRFKALNLLNTPSSIRNERDEYSLRVEFNEGCLVMSSFHASEASEKILRNVIAYEHCHEGLTPFTSNYIHFLNFLIIKKEDVDVLIEEGVLTNGMGRPINVVKMVNSLQTGLTEADTSQYQNIARNLKAHCKSRTRRCWTTLKKVYFADLWTGTATIYSRRGYVGHDSDWDGI